MIAMPCPDCEGAGHHSAFSGKLRWAVQRCQTCQGRGLLSVVLHVAEPR
jgi:DnaJ-class molecular chaperone